MIKMEPMFKVRCDPPYEEMDGGEGECLNNVCGTDLPEFLAGLAAKASRLLPGQVPMIIEVSLLMDPAECAAQGHTPADHADPSLVAVDWEDQATRQVNYV